ncbi:hypothetical protein [Synechococcus sp. UW140]|uniref:hypothetical protein n=1 Tax=Synechococcus sp. UW140 TaxID=368503 RepID=UPI000E0E75D7|nr:hypothetical protein [Synechococcus sp. UW140]
MSNYAQIVDGIEDQIQDLLAAQTNYTAQLEALQAELDRIPQQIADLEALKTSAQSLSSNQIDINLNITGANLRSHSTPVGS